MNKYLYSLTIVAVASLYTHAVCASNNIRAKIVGDELVWITANEIEDYVQQLIWQPASVLNLFPTYEWTPTFQKSPLTSIMFRSAKGNQVEVSFDHIGVQFIAGSHFTERQVNSVANICTHVSSRNNQFEFALRELEDSLCMANLDLKAKAKYPPFDFYRSIFQMNNIVEEFKGAPAGYYFAAIDLPLTYYMKYDTAATYQTYNTKIIFSIDYTPYFFDAVTVLGDGTFTLEYNTSDNSVSGKTTYHVRISGELEPGVKMEFESARDKSKFHLIGASSSDTIPYNLLCTKCDKKNVVEAGNLKQKISKISNPGKDVDFDLVFSFENLKYGTVGEGKYQDIVTVRFGLDM